MSSTIVVPIDGSKYSAAALDVAADLADKLGAKILLCHVVDIAKAAAMTFGEPGIVSGCFDGLRADGEAILAEAAAGMKKRGIAVEQELIEGDVVDGVNQLARQRDAAFVVMGSHGRSGLDRLLMGSVAEGVVRHCDRPVIVVPRAAVGAAKSLEGTTK